MIQRKSEMLMNEMRLSRRCENGGLGSAMASRMRSDCSTMVLPHPQKSLRQKAGPHHTRSDSVKKPRRQIKLREAKDHYPGPSLLATCRQIESSTGRFRFRGRHGGLLGDWNGMIHWHESAPTAVCLDGSFPASGYDDPPVRWYDVRAH